MDIFICSDIMVLNTGENAYGREMPSGWGLFWAKIDLNQRDVAVGLSNFAMSCRWNQQWTQQSSLNQTPSPKAAVSLLLSYYVSSWSFLLSPAICKKCSNLQSASNASQRAVVMPPLIAVALLHSGWVWVWHKEKGIWLILLFYATKGQNHADVVYSLLIIAFNRHILQLCFNTRVLLLQLMYLFYQCLILAEFCHHHTLLQ